MAALFVGAAAGFPALAAEEPLLITYGRDAATLEGDHDHRLVIFVSVPEDHAAPVHLRVFDPDTGGTFDTAYGAWNDSKTRFAVFAGPGAFAMPENRDAVPPPGGELIAERTFAWNRSVDGTWITLATLDPAQGDLVHDRRVFRLVVEGTAGDDGNVYAVAASASEDENVDVPDARLYSFRPTFRVLDDDLFSELRFIVPNGVDELTVFNFDAAFATMTFTTQFRTVPLRASGQGVWDYAKVAIEERDRGNVAAVTIQGGDELPNDVTIFVATSNNRFVPMDVPPLRWPGNTRPSAGYTSTPNDCHAVNFDVRDAQDANGDDLTYLWYFPGGKIVSGGSVTHAFGTVGTHPVRLEVIDASGVVGNGWAENFEITIKAPPVAHAMAPLIAALGEPVRLDGTRSYSDGYDIARFSWRLSDGSTHEGAYINHAFRTIGSHTIGLSVVDAADHPCNGDGTERLLRVNARPVAVAGEDLHVATGEIFRLDAGASADPDGEALGFAWDLGDGARTDGPVVEHSYAAPGIYHVRLNADDATGVSNRAGLDVARVVVNAPPVAEVEAPQSAFTGEVMTFDARGSHDPDGSIASYRWRFGDGSEKSGAVVTHAYFAPGKYDVALRVEDGSQLANGIAFDQMSVTVRDAANTPPVAAAGADMIAAVGEIVSFDGSASADPDGNIVAYHWNFEPGGEATSVVAQYTFLQAGDYDVELTVHDNSGKPNAAATDTVRVRVVVPENDTPIARIGADITAEVGQIVTFDASASRDPDGNVVAYAWEFGDGAKGWGVSPAYTYFAEGVYRVTVTVTDDSEFIGTAADSLTVVVLPSSGAQTEEQ